MASGDSLLQWAPHGASYPATNYPQLSTRNNRPILRFDTTTQETAYFVGIMPKHYAGGNLKVLVSWSATSATSGTIGWDATFERVLAGTDDTDSDGFATAQTVTAATVSATSGVTSITSVTCTAGSTGTDSVAAGDLVRLRIRRDVANDTATGDAEIHMVYLEEA